MIGFVTSFPCPCCRGSIGAMPYFSKILCLHTSPISRYGCTPIPPIRIWAFRAGMFSLPGRGEGEKSVVQTQVLKVPAIVDDLFFVLCKRWSPTPEEQNSRSTNFRVIVLCINWLPKWRGFTKKFVKFPKYVDSGSERQPAGALLTCGVVYVVVDSRP